MGLTVKEEKTLRLKQFLIHIYGSELGLKRYLAIVKSSNLKVLIFKYGKEEGIYRFNNTKEKHKIKNTLQGFIMRYGEKEGPSKYYEKNKKLSVSVESLKLSGKTEEEIYKIRSIHKQKSAQTLENFILRYGDKLGKEKFKIFNENNRISYRSINQLINRRGLTEEEAKKIVKSIQIRDEKFYIKKYGKELGQQKFEETNKKRAFANTKQYYIEKYGDDGIEMYEKILKKRIYTLSKEYYIEKYGDKKGIEVYLNNKIKNRDQYNGDSKIQLKFAQQLYNALPEHIQNQFIGPPITQSKIIYINSEDIKISIPDILIQNIIIEFDGNYWHTLPDIIVRDLLKTKILTEKGYNIIRVNELDYIKDKYSVIQNVIEKILKLIRINNEN